MDNIIIDKDVAYILISKFYPQINFDKIGFTSKGEHILFPGQGCLLAIGIGKMGSPYLSDLENKDQYVITQNDGWAVHNRETIDFRNMLIRRIEKIKEVFND